MSIRFVGLAAAALFALPGAASAVPITIDDFTVGQNFGQFGPGSVSQQVSGPSGAIITGQRDSMISIVGGANPNAAISISSGIGGFTSGAIANPMTSFMLEYDGIDANNTTSTTTPFDLTSMGSNEGILIGIRQIDIGTSMVEFELVSALGTSTMARTFSSADNSSNSFFAFSDFSVDSGAGADPTALTRLKVTISNSPNTDAFFTFFDAAPPPPEVPLPGALPMFVGALGLLGVGAYRRRARA